MKIIVNLINQRYDMGLVLASIGTCLLIYALPFDAGQGFFVARLVFIGALLLAAGTRFLGAWIFHRKKIKQQGIDPFMFVCLSGLVFGFLFCANMFVMNPVSRPALKVLEIPQKKIPVFKDKEVVSPGGTLAVGDYRELSCGSDYSKNIFGFTSHYGLLFIAIGYIVFLRSRAERTGKVPVDWNVWYDCFLACVVLLPLLFFFADCLDYGNRAWLKSRFLEIPYYFIWIVFAQALHHFGTKKEKIIIGVFLIVYCVVPFVATQRIKQTQKNYKIYKIIMRIKKLGY
jgi:hypothetical protein